MVTATISGLTITNGGTAVPGGSGISSLGSNLTLRNLIITGNHNGGISNGGGILNLDAVSVTNNDGNSGGGIRNDTGIVNVIGSTLSNNSAGVSAGGGISNNSGTVNVRNSNISGNNSPGDGGGILHLGGTLTITSSTLSNNSSPGGGGGVSNGTGTINLDSVTIADNQATGIGGGIRNQIGGVVNARNSIVANNTSNGAGPDIAGPLVSQGYNLIENTTDATITGTTTGNITGQDPVLGTLQFNGGSTQTRALLTGSPAIDSGDPANVLPVDQRNIPRPLDGDSNGSAVPDIGAFEAGAMMVTKTADTDDGVCDADCSLREAISTANTSPANDAITFSSLFASPRTIVLSGTELVLADSGAVSIVGPGVKFLAISGNGMSRSFRNVGSNSTISDMTLTGGDASDGHGGGVRNIGVLILNNIVLSGNIDGGISNDTGTMTVNNCTITGNSAAVGAGIENKVGGNLTVNGSTISGNTATNLGGGGIYNVGSLNVNNSVITGNSSTQGAGILLENGSTTINNSTISSNVTQGNGGGIAVNNGTLSLFNSTLSNNTALLGGGISTVLGSMTHLTNSTISGNSALGNIGRGGGGNFSGTVNIRNVTVNQNRSNIGGGIYGPLGTINAGNTIIADNTATTEAPDLSGTLVSQGYNLLENISGAAISGTTAGNIIGVDPQLITLRNYGGATQTVGLMPNSPAIDAADPVNYPATDQRGIARPQDGDLNGTALPDIGAYERQVVTLTVTKTADANDGVCDTDCSLREAVIRSNSSTLPDHVVIFHPTVFSSSQTLVLTNDHLDIENIGTLLIAGTGRNSLTINGNGQSRVFFNRQGSALMLKSLTVANGFEGFESAGAIYNSFCDSDAERCDRHELRIQLRRWN